MALAGVVRVEGGEGQAVLDAGAGAETRVGGTVMRVALAAVREGTVLVGAAAVGVDAENASRSQGDDPLHNEQEQRDELDQGAGHPWECISAAGSPWIRETWTPGGGPLQAMWRPATAGATLRGRRLSPTLPAIMLANVLQFCGGLVLLLVGGRLLVSASVDTAKRLRISPLVVGLTLVAWGTSAPELALNLISASKGRGDLALGNVVGANICNIALVLGLCALIKPLVVQERLIKVEIWLNAAILGSMTILGVTGGFQEWEAGLMLGVFGSYSMWTIMAALRQSDTAQSPASDPLGDDPTREKCPMGWVMIAACFVGGLSLLSLGGSLASDGASGMAMSLGVPAAVVGVTVVSIGTTLPELVTGLMAVRKGQTDLAMGNAIGSCLFNAGAIFGIVGLVSLPSVDGTLTLPLAYMGVLAIALVPISRTFGKTVSRLEGGVLLTSYVGFLALSAVSAA